MRCYRIELVRFFTNGCQARSVRFEDDEVAAHAVYQSMVEDDSVGEDERTRGVFIDILEVSTDGDLAEALRRATCSRYDLDNLRPVARSADAF